MLKLRVTEMPQSKPDRSECVKSPFGFPNCQGARGGEGRESPNRLPAFIPRIAKFAAPKFIVLCALAFVGWGVDISRAQTSQGEISDAEKASYADALAYCRGDVPRPMALRNDKRVLCLNGEIGEVTDFWIAGGLEKGGLFVVRGRGGNYEGAMALADMLLTREAIVVVNDYCVGICANYLFVASVKTFVPKGALVAWANHAIGADDCYKFYEMDDSDAPRLEQLPCNFPKVVDSGTRERIRLKEKFYEGRVLSWMEQPPESIAVRKILKQMLDATGYYPVGVYWTWNPRFYAGAIKTKVVYEAYPQSQEEVDAIVARIGLPNSVIYDP